MFDAAERSLLASMLPTMAAGNGADYAPDDMCMQSASSLVGAEDDVDVEARSLSNAGWVQRMCVCLHSYMLVYLYVSLVANIGKGNALPIQRR